MCDPALVERVERCPLCGSSVADAYGCRDRLLGLTGEFAFARCIACGSGVLSVRPTEKALARYYPEDYGPYGRRPERAHRSLLGRIVRRLLLLVPVLLPDAATKLEEELRRGDARAPGLLSRTRCRMRRWAAPRPGCGRGVGRHRRGFQPDRRGVREAPGPRRVVIGRIGTAANLGYLDSLRDTIRKIQREGSVPTEFRVISSRPPAWPGVDVSFRRWTLERAIDDIADLDIGLMPLPDTPWTRGKCGAKALEYMALGVPSIASPVGVMPQILEHGRSGLLAGDPAQWRLYLDRLVADSSLRRRLGDAGRRRVADRFSVRATAPRLAALLESVAAPDGAG